MVEHRWVAGERPGPGLVVRQVYGYVRDAEGRYLVLDDSGSRTLPGGKPEAFDADEVATLRRECLEEAQAAVADPVYLGHVVVTDGTGTYAQVRYRASLVELGDAAPDPATGRSYVRSFVALDALDAVLAWGPHGSAQLETLRAIGA